ncbi:hypothetical protein QUF80_17875 [Desulfococcaceae bacterium HSG8]|nr:hypothetical protein [Desulfococcaceae bacterium HSG8]
MVTSPGYPPCRRSQTGYRNPPGGSTVSERKTRRGKSRQNVKNKIITDIYH